jgi:hypothetical protein
METKRDHNMWCVSQSRLPYTANLSVDKHRLLISNQLLCVILAI